MNIDEVLLRALRAGVTLALDGDRLTFRAPNGLPPELRDLLVSHRAALVAALSGESSPAVAPIVRTGGRPQDGGRGAFGLSSGQERLWLVEQRHGPSPLHHVHVRLRWRGRLDRDALGEAARALVARHGALRTVFPVLDGVPRAEVRPESDPESVDLAHLDPRDLPPGARDEAVATFLETQRSTPFDLAAGPLTRLGAVSLGDDEHLLALTQHHLITDGWSVALLLSQWLEAYGAVLLGRREPVPAPPVEYADYVRWERARRGEPDHARRVEWWAGHLAGLAPLELPRDREALPGARDHRGASERLRVPPETVAGLERVARRLDTTLYTVLLAAWAVLLHRVTGQETFPMGTVTSGRDEAVPRDAVGFFANTVVLRCDLGGGPDVREVIRRLRTETREAFAREVPFGDVVAAVGGTADSGLTPLIQAALVFEVLPAVRSGDGSGVPGVRSLSVDTRVDGGVDGTATFDLSLILGREGDALDGLVEYAPAYVGSDLVVRLRDQLPALLSGIAAGPSPLGAGMPASCCERAAEHEAFFRAMLGEVTEPCAPFGPVDARRNGAEASEARVVLDARVAGSVRAGARAWGVSVASVFHQAWAQVLARVTDREDVVFGTAVFGTAASGTVLPVRVGAGAVGAGAGVRATHRLLTDLVRHEHASPALARRCAGVPAGAPLFTSVLDHRAGPPVAAGAVAVAVSVEELGGEFALTVRSRVAVGARAVGELLATAVTGLATALARSVEVPLRDLDVLPAGERQRVLEEFNATGRPVPVGATVHGLFEARVALAPDAVAVVHGERRLTYGQVNARANQVAHRLRAGGVGPESLVGICAERGPDLLVGILGILKAGGAYVPLDPSYPVARLAHMLTDSAPAVVLAGGAGIAALRNTSGVGAGCPVVALDGVLEGAFDAYPATDPADAGIGGSAAAYVMYTSGSTGVPKGVVVEHRNIVSLVLDNGFLAFGTDDRVAFAANPSFDAATFEVWGAWANGARLVVVDEADVLDPDRFGAVLSSAGVSVLWLTVGLFNRYRDALGGVLGGLRCLVVGGDALDPVSVAAVLRENPPGRLFNGYGPTETTTFAAVHPIDEVGAGSVPIGRPIAGTRIYILDGRGRPVPVGVVGESVSYTTLTLPK
uniref:AMP-binding protein n=1 Tax=Streptomyces sp. SBT349 TaxID=1580539 RepID=UPI00066E8BD3